MLRKNRSLSRLITFLSVAGLLLAGPGLGLPAVHADDGHPPKTGVSDSGGPGTGGPDQPVGGGAPIPPLPPTGCPVSFAFANNSASQAINDFQTITSTIYVTTSATLLWDVNVRTDITHTYNSDLDIHLISPAGTIVTLSNRNGGSFDNIFHGTHWDDQAGRTNGSGLPVTDYGFTNNVPAAALNPQEPLGALQGQNPNGAWQLVVHDNAGGDTGQLLSWALELQTFTRAPDFPATATVSSSAVTPIPNNGSVSRALSFAGVVPPITSLVVSTVITHPNPGGLNVYLVSPAGITITLSTNNGLTNTNVFAGTTWNDQAGQSNPPGSVTENAFVNGTPETPLAPEEALSELDGDSPNGTWHLVVEDPTGSGAGRLLGPVSITAHIAHCLPEVSANIFVAASDPLIGLPLNLSFRAFNSGDTASQVMLTATLPLNAQYLSMAPGPWSCASPAAGSVGGQLRCSLASLSAYGEEGVTVTVAGPPAPVSSSAFLTVSQAGLDPNPGNNSRNHTIDFWAFSANHNPLDISTADGSLEDGGQDAFDTFGELRVAVYQGVNLISDTLPSGFNLLFTPEQRWSTGTAQTVDTVRIVRSLYAPLGVNWVRYLDTFINTGGVARKVIVAWGGNLGSDNNTYTAGSSSGDLVIGPTDTWAVTQQDPPPGPAGDAVVAYAFRSPSDTTYLGPTDITADPITTAWPSIGNDNLGHTFQFNLAPGATVRLAYFLYRGLAEGYPGPEDCGFYGGCTIPATGAQVTLAKNVVAALVARPAFCDLTPAVRATVLNWPAASGCLPLFLPVIER